MSAQTKLRVWVAHKKVGEVFTVKDAEAHLASQGFKPGQSGPLLTYMVTWWKLVKRVGHGKYKRI